VEARPALSITRHRFLRVARRRGWQQDAFLHYHITCADQPVFGFAGLWDTSGTDEGKPIESCTIITIPPNPLLAEIHNVKQRMPAILQSEDIEAWLMGSVDDAQGALKRYPAETMTAWPASRRVNTPKNDHETLIEPETPKVPNEATAALDPGPFVLSFRSSYVSLTTFFGFLSSRMPMNLVWRR
jgi:SOS response associated peptidase (SRAP)